MTRRNPKPKLPTGKFIKCEGVVLTSSGRVKKMKISDRDLKRASVNPKKRNPGRRLKGRLAIAYAEKHDLTLQKYADPTEGHRSGLSPSEARDIAREDPSLIYLDIPSRTKKANRKR
jgi:hypothetical protein